MGLLFFFKPHVFNHLRVAESQPLTHILNIHSTPPLFLGKTQIFHRAQSRLEYKLHFPGPLRPGKALDYVAANETKVEVTRRLFREQRHVPFIIFSFFLVEAMAGARPSRQHNKEAEQ